MSITISSHELVPMEPGDELGMPTYVVVGTRNDAPFTATISVEIDGRDVEFTDCQGLSDGDEYLRRSEVFDALCETKSWLDLHNAKTEEFYNQHLESRN